MTRYRWVAARKAEGFPITMACRVAEVSRQAFGDWRARQAAGPSSAEVAEAALVAEIREIHDESVIARDGDSICPLDEFDGFSPTTDWACFGVVEVGAVGEERPHGRRQDRSHPRHRQQHRIVTPELFPALAGRLGGPVGSYLRSCEVREEIATVRTQVFSGPANARALPTHHSP